VRQSASVPMQELRFAGKGKKKKLKVAAWNDVPDDSESELGSDGADWVMHEPSLPDTTQKQGSAHADKLSIKKRNPGKKPKKRSGGLDAFASADDYLQQIETDLASLPADVASTGHDEDPVPARSRKPGRRNQSVRKPKGRKA